MAAIPEKAYLIHPFHTRRGRQLKRPISSFIATHTKLFIKYSFIDKTGMGDVTPMNLMLRRDGRRAGPRLLCGFKKKKKNEQQFAQE